MATSSSKSLRTLISASRHSASCSSRQIRKPWMSCRALQTTPQFVESQPDFNTTPSAPSTATKPVESDFLTDERHPARQAPASSPIYDISRAPSKPSPLKGAAGEPLKITQSLRENLPSLTAQGPFYARIHIHGMPYLVTAGDEVRLPFLMHGVMPGDILRLDRATTIGSRDWTLVGGTPRGAQDDNNSSPTVAEPIVGRTDGLVDTPYPKSSTNEIGRDAGLRKKGPSAYIDDRLFVCRATVTGTESEPLRIMEKTKRRQRHIKHVRSKHRYTILRITEVTPRTIDELEAEAEAEAA